MNFLQSFGRLSLCLIFLFLFIGINHTFAQNADISIEKKDVSDNTPDEGQSISYDIEIKNNGPDQATGLSFLDLLPSGLTFVSATPQQGTYNDTTGVWNVGSLASGQKRTLEVVATVDTGFSGMTISNTISLNSLNETDPDATNNSFTTDVIVNAPDIQVIKTVSNGPYNEGANVIYTINVRNNGPADATGLEVIDQLPSLLQYVSDNPDQGTYDTTTGIWNIGALASGQNRDLQIVAFPIIGSSGLAVNNVASLESLDQNDPNSTNNQSNVEIEIATVDLLLTKVVNDNSPDELQIVEFTLVIENLGPGDATNVEILDLLPAGLTFVAFTTIEAGTPSHSAGLITWDIASLPEGDKPKLEYTAQVGSGYAAQTITNTAEVDDFDQVDPLSSNNSASVDLFVNGADVSITKSVDNPAPNPGDTIAYTIVVTNNGPLKSDNVVIYDALPAGVTFVSSSADESSYSAVTNLWGGTGNLDLNAFEIRTLTILATINAGTIGSSLVNTAYVQSAVAPDSYTFNDTASAIVAIGEADLGVSKSVNVSVVDEGDPIEYTIIVENYGPHNAPLIEVLDLLPSELTYTSHIGGNYNNTTGVWSIGTLDFGSKDTLTINATVNTGTAGRTIENIASVSSPMLEPIAATNSNLDTALFQVSGADLAISKTTNAVAPIVEGDVVVYDLIITNNGPDDATTIEVHDLLPTNLSLDSYLASEGTYNATTGIWSGINLLNGESDTLSLTTTVVSGGGITNTASIIASSELDSYTENNSSSAFISALKTFGAGSCIIDLGQVPQTQDNTLKAYGLVYELVANNLIPVWWSIRPDKSFQSDTAKVDEIDFSVDTTDYRTGAFIIEDGFVFLAQPIIDSWLGTYPNVKVDCNTPEFEAPIHEVITSFPRAVLDDANGDKVQTAFFDPAAIQTNIIGYNDPPTNDEPIYDVFRPDGTPLNLTECDDVYAMPHADPHTWTAAERDTFYNYINGGGWLFAACHAVSALETLVDVPQVPGGAPQLNLLSENGLIEWGDHGDGTPPYSYSTFTGNYNAEVASDPFMQNIGTFDNALQNGSEQIYIPFSQGWRPSTTVAVYDPDQPEAFNNGAFPTNSAAAVVYGRSFGDPNLGMVMYEASHTFQGGSEAENVAAARVYGGFWLQAGVEFRPTINPVAIPKNLNEGVAAGFEVTGSGRSAPLSYQWLSSCSGTFSSPDSSYTNFTPAEVDTTDECVVRLILQDGCGRQNFLAEFYKVYPSADVEITKTATPFANIGDTITYTIEVYNNGPSYADEVTMVDSLSEDVTFISYTATKGTWESPTWDVGIIDSGAVETLVIKVLANTSLPSGYLVNTATVFTPASNNDTTNDVSSDSTFINTPPVAVDDTAATGVDIAIVIDVLDLGIADSDVESNILISSVGSTPGSGDNGSNQGGTLSFNDNGTPADSTDDYIDYTPPSGYSGLDTFYYVITDAGGLTDTAQVVITIVPNLPPTISQPPVEVPEDSTITFCPVVSDPDAGDVLTVSSCGDPVNGVATIDTICITYTPNPNYNGPDSMCVVVCDNGVPVLCDTVIVPITVTPVNDPPLAVDDNGNTPEDTPVTVDVLNNDTDLDGNIDPASVAEVTPPANGSTSVDPVTGEITYTPDTNFNGTDSFTYVVCDDGTPLPAQCDTATVTVVVNPVNDPPLAVDDADNTNEDTPVVIDVTNNDTDLDGNIDPTTVTEVTPPSNGSTSVDPVTGEITYTPDPNFNGTDVFTYVVCDDGTPLPAQCDTATVTVVVNPVNDPPLAVDDTDTTNEDAPVVIDVTANDTDLDGNIDPTSVAEVTPPANGSTSVDPVTGEITYTPDPNFNGTDVFTYVVCDDGTPLPAQCDTATVTIEVNPVNDPPLAVDDADTTNEDTQVVIDVTSNDTDLDGNIDPATVAEVTPPANGSTSVNPVTGEITYTPDPDFNGTDVFTYVVCDDGTPLPAQCDTATVTVVVNPVNDPPLAVDDADTTNEDTPVVIDVTSNDTDLDGNIDPATVAEVTPPANGSTSVNPTTGEITYTPDPDFNGTDVFTYVVCDDGTPLPAQCDTATVTIVVNPVNDPPVAANDAVGTSEDTPVVIVVLTNDNDNLDPQGNIDSTTVAEVSPPVNGSTSVDTITGEITYTPNLGFNGLDSFTYVVCDDGFPLPPLCDTALVVVNVGAVNDTPSITQPPVVVPEDSTITFCPVVSDPDAGDVLTVSSCGDPVNGVATIDTNCITYTPNPNYNGPDTMCVVVCDNGIPVLCDTVLVPITVTPINDPPLAVDDADTTNEDTPVVIDVTANDTDLDGNIDSTTVAEVSPPVNGSTSVNPVTGEITYTPDPNFTGTDVFTYVVCDDGTPLPALCDTATVTVVVNPVNDPPLAVDDADTTDEDTPVVIDVTANDTDLDGNIDPATVAEVTPPANGSTSVNPVTGEITYTPDPNFSGTDVFTYVVCDDGTPLPAECDTATVTVVVNPVNDPPLAVDDADTTDEDTPVVIDVTSNDTDLDGNIDPASVAEVTPPANGSTSVNPITGEITYTPDPNFTGTDVFTYVVCDDGTPLPAQCDTATVTVVVNPVNDPPLAANDAVGTSEDTPVVIVVLTNDNDNLDPQGNIDSTTVAEITPPVNGSTSVNPVTGEITYTPNLGFNGLDSFTYVVCDDGFPLPPLCDTALVVVNVGAVNDTPSITQPPVVVPEDSTVTFCPVVSDPDAGDVLTVSSCGDPVNGVATIDTNCITYTPNPNYNGADTMCVVVCDNGIPVLCDTVLVPITVTPVNDPPLAVNDSSSTLEDTPVVIVVLTNDNDNLDPQGNIDSTTVTEVTPPVNGITSVDPVTGEITYTPDPGFNGLDTFTYVVCDDGTPLPSLCDTAQVVVNVGAVNDPPMISQPPVDTPEDSTVTFCPTISDPDAGDVLTLSLCTPPSNGTAVLDGTGLCVDYTPNPNYNGPDTACVIVCDDGVPVLCDTVLVPITVLPVNDPPLAVDDSDTTNEDTPVVIDVINNDTDIDGNIDPASVAEVTPPSNGSTSVNPTTGEVTYTPDPGFNGTDVFTYVVCDDGTPLPAQCDTATVTIFVAPVNDPPLAVDDADTTNEDTPVVIDVIANDTDTDGNIDPASVAEVTPPSNGSTSVNPATGEITYTPDLNFNGTDVFTYVVCDDGTPLPAQCDTATVTVLVNPVNDPPVAVDDAAGTPEDTPVVIDVLDDDTDVDGNIVPSSVAEVTPPSNGSTSVNPATGEITYTPDPGFNGLDTFTYVVCDDGTPLPSLCDTAQVVVNVGAVNDPPMISQPPVDTPEDSTVTFCPTISDPDMGDVLTLSLCTPPANGSAVLDGTGLCVDYTPNPNYNGPDTACVIVCDNGTPVLCDTVLVPITVTPVNDPPVAVDDAETTNEDTPVVVEVTNNDTDIDGNIDPSSVAEVTPPSNGLTSVNPTTGEITYTPDPNFNGMDTFTYVVCDDGTPLPAQCDTAQVIITVNPVNDPPLALDNSSVSNEDTPVVVDVTPNDTDTDGNIDPATVAEVTPPNFGSTSVNPTTGEITYTPNANYNGTDLFTYVVCDDGTPLPAQCDTATVFILINPVNDPPVALNDAETTNEDTPVIVDVTNNDTDIDGNIDPGSVAEVTPPGNGTTSVNPTTGEITYTPDPGFSGVDSFTYVVCDDGTPLPSLCDTATVVITVNEVNQPPLAVDDTETTNEDTPVVVDVTANDTDSDGNIDPATVAEVTPPSFGSTSVDTTTGEITYTPDLNYNGTDLFTYVVCDDGTPLPAQCDTATVFILINPVNDPPVAVDDVDGTPEDTPVTVIVLNNDSDVDGNLVPASVAEVIPPLNGSTSVDTITGEIIYTPNPAFSGVDSFTYVVCDDGTPLPSLCDTAQVVITVNSINDPLMAVDDIDTTDEDTPVVIDVTANDVDTDGNIDPASVAEVTPPSNGSTSVNTTTGDITYTPDPNFNGVDTFTYVVCDDGTPLPATCDTAQVIVVVNPVNDPIIAVDDTASTNEDTPVLIPVTNNDTDVDGNIDLSSVAEVSPPSNGSTSVNPTTGDITYTPDPNFNGLDTFTYVVCDDGTPLPAQCDTAQVIVTVIPVNDPPLIVQPPVVTPEDSTVIFCPTISDPDMVDVLTLSFCTPPTNGVAVLDGTGLCVEYTPNPNYNGPDTACVIVCDNGSPVLCDTVLVPITVIPVNDPPVAVDDVDGTPEDTPVTVIVLNNDSDVDGNLVPASVAEVTPPVNGSTSVNPTTGEITYTPGPGFSGVDSFTYVVCDDGTPLPSLCDTAQVVISVSSINDDILAVDDADTTNEDTPIVIDVTANDIDTDGNIDPSSVAEVTPPSNGSTSVDTITGDITYTPDPNFNGVDTFTYVVCDDGTPLPATCDTAQVIVTVIPVNDPPLIVQPPVVTPEDSVVTFCPTLTDPDMGDNLTLSLCTLPANGTAVLDSTGLCVEYTPNPGFNGPDTACVIVCDNGMPVLCDTIFVPITVIPINDSILAVDDADTTNEDTPVVIDVIANDLDTDGNIDSTSVAEITPPSNGSISIDSLTGQITYTPDSNFNGIDTFTYVVCDDGTPLPATCDTAQVIVTVIPVNDPPSIIQPPVVTPEDSAVTFCPTLTDPDTGDSLTMSLCTPPANGLAGLDSTGLCVVYTPNPNYNGPDTACVIVCDNGNPVLCDTVLVPITVTPVNDPPMITQAPVVTPEDSAVTFCPTLSDPDMGDSLTMSLCTPPSNGMLVLDSTGLCVTYTPDPGYNGPDTACIIVCDDGVPVLCDTVFVPITVTGINNPPLAVDDAVSTNEDSSVVIIVIANDTDTDGNIDPTSVAEVTPPLNGSTSVDPVTGEIVYTPDPNFNGVDSFTYVVCDDGTPLPPQCDTATVVIDVIPVNDPPIAVDDFESTPINIPVTIAVTANDTDIDGNIDPTSVTIISNPSNGAVSVDSITGEVIYTPNPDYVGTDTFTYVVCDDGTPLPAQCDTAIVVITIVPPFIEAVNDTITLTSLDARDIVVLNNDRGAENAVVSIVSDPSNGTVTINDDGSITYLPNDLNQEEDVFSYAICIGTICDTAEVYIFASLVTDLLIPNSFSPNGDGVNDVFFIRDLIPFPESTIKIYNRWGDEVWRSDGPYLQNWNGISFSNDLLPDGTYYYIIDLNEEGQDDIAGFIQLHR